MRRVSVVDYLDGWAETRSDRTAYISLSSAESELQRWTFRDLRAHALLIAERLREHSNPGDRALLGYGPGLDFIAAFLGCLYAGVVAVPINLPRKSRFLDKFSAVARDCHPRLALTTAVEKLQLDGWLHSTPHAPALAWHATDEWIDAGGSSRPRAVGHDPDALAFIQYTSGSTGDPKGVMVSHGNLVANEMAIKESFGHGDDTRFVGWLPLFHDMGLIGNVLQPLFLGISSVLISPVDFLQNPALWLRAISRYQGTTAGGPNFGYEHCVARIRPEQMDGVSLASWDVAYNGAEPIRAHTLDAFSKRFAPHGFRRGAFYPCYGMAEVTLFATGGAKGQPEVRAFDPAGLETGQASETPGAAARQLVSCGWSWCGEECAVVDPATALRCPDGKVGEIWLCGPSVARGYWNRDDETLRVFHNRLADQPDGTSYLRTGDLGFSCGGRLYITGRLKDMIVIRGSNHYPQDIELTVECAHPALAPGGGATFSIERDGLECLVVVHEIELARRHGIDVKAIRAAVTEAVATNHGLSVHEIVLLQPRALPKTSSGKVQRGACRQAFLKGTLSEFKSSEAAKPAP